MLAVSVQFHNDLGAGIESREESDRCGVADSEIAPIGDYEVSRNSRWTLLVPATIVLLLLLIYLISGPLIESTIAQGLLVRCLIVIALVGCAALPMGMCFPLGLRLFRKYSSECLLWMWGVNGAMGVLASVFAVAISMWGSINTSLLIAVGCYALLAVPARMLQLPLRNANGLLCRLAKP